MKFTLHSPEILEAWSTWETFRKLGFSSDDLFWEFTNVLTAVPGPGLALQVVLKTQDKDFRVTCSRRLTEERGRKLEAEARKFFEAMNANQYDHDDMRHVLHASWIWKNQTEFVEALIAKGFVFPFRMN